MIDFRDSSHTLPPRSYRCHLLGLFPGRHLSPLPAGESSIAKKISGMKRMAGFIPLDWDEKEGKLYIEIGNFNKDFLLFNSLPYGVGSNDLGLDRGKFGSEHLVRFYRSGSKVLLIEENLNYRSSSTVPEEQLSIEQSFAHSVLYGFKVEAEEGGRVLVDGTDYLLSDTWGVGESIRVAKPSQGDYSLEGSRSAIIPENTKNFPLNTEIESILTFISKSPISGSFIDSVTPDAHAVTVREHISFIQLPDDGYRPRVFDPRAGYFDQSYRDYSAPLGQPLGIHLILRHRLEKKDPSAAVSEPIKPIIYYVDRGAPELIRNALVDGASWWNQAFESAGFRNAFRVEVLPKGQDPMDVRYNVIQWVHRSTRGWSYGGSIVDPRTGEIITGRVTLGSLRARQDYLIGEALLSPYAKGKPVSDEIREMVLARIRQLAAHEVGHTLGLADNFSGGQFCCTRHFGHGLSPSLDHARYRRAARSFSRVTALPSGNGIRLPSNMAIRNSPLGKDEHAALDDLLRKATDRGLLFITDDDSRPLGSAHPHAHLWDNGSDPAFEPD